MEHIEKGIKYLADVLQLCASGKYNLGVSEKPIKENGENYIHTMCTGMGIYTRQYEYKGYTLNYGNLSVSEFKILNIDMSYSDDNPSEVILKKLLSTVCKNYKYRELLSHDMVLMQNDKIVKRFTHNVFADIVKYFQTHKYITRFESERSTRHPLGCFTVTFPEKLTSVNVYGKFLPLGNGNVGFNLNRFVETVMWDMFFEADFKSTYSFLSDKIEYDRLMTLYELE